MKKIKIANLIVCMTLLLCNISSAQTNNKKYKIIKSKLETIVPQGWTLNSKNNEFVLSKDKDVKFYNFMSMYTGEKIKNRLQHGHTKKFKIKLIITSLIKQTSHNKMKSLNDLIVVGKGTPIIESEFYINNYGKFQNYDPNYQELPNYHIDEFSIYSYTTQHPNFAIWPEEVAEECDNVIKNLKIIFNKYKKTNKSLHTD